jgi:hypothetical protein
MSTGEQRGAFDLRDDIHIKLAQAKGICRVIHGAGDLAEIGKDSIQYSLWVVDELLDDAKKAVDDLYQQCTEKGRSDAPQKPEALPPSP